MTRVHVQAQGQTWQESLPGDPDGNGVQAALSARGYADTPELSRAVEAAARWLENASDAQVMLARSDPELGQPVLALAALSTRVQDHA